jgi:hypothetical protein
MTQALLLLAVLGPCLAALYGYIPSLGGSFRCDDPTIQFPYTGDTITTKQLLLGVLLPVAGLLFLTELFHVQRAGWRKVTAAAAAAMGSIFLRWQQWYFSRF